MPLAQPQSLIKVKTKFQLTLPTRVRRAMGVDVGDFFEARIQNRTIVLSPKSVIDKGISQSMRDVKSGRVHGPYSTIDDLFRSLDKKTKIKK